MQMYERIRLARVRAGLTQKQVADHFGISRPTVTQWESGDYRPDQDKFPELAQILHVTLDWLMNEDGAGPSGDGKVSRPPASPKFLKSSKHKFYVRQWREFMGSSVESGARAAGLASDEYQAFETYPINFTLGQIGALADEFGIRGDQFWWEPPEIKAAATKPRTSKRQSRRGAK